MASAFLENLYNIDDITFDLRAICKKTGIEFIKGYVSSIDGKKKNVTLEDGRSLPFDILSVNTGSDVAGKDIPLVTKYSIPVKPLTGLVSIRNQFTALPNDMQIVIAGAGAAGIEIALALRAESEKQEKDVNITLVDSNSEIMKDYSIKVKTIVLKELEKKDITLLLNNRIISVEKDEILLNSKQKVTFHILVWAGGSLSHPLYKNSGLTVDKKGYLVVNKTLQSVDYPYIFGVGDCISFRDYDYVRKVGVYAIREAPVLFQNIMRYINGENLKEYLPQRDYLSIVSTGDKRAVLQYKSFVAQGRISWLVKNWIDKRFMKDFSEYF